MDEVVFSDFGIEIIRRGGRLFMRYDSGGVASHLVEREISEQEAQQAQQSEQTAYRVILRCESAE